MRKIFVLLCVAAISRSQTPEARIEQIIQSYVTGHQFMGSVLIAKGDQILFDKGYGYANLEWQIPNGPDAKFRLGSATKQFTAACILLLEERGKLKTDDLVKKYLPDAPASWDKITIYHLLTHTSGIPDFTSFPDYGEIEKKPASPEEIVKRFRDKPLDFEPGAKFSYSNSGYVLLGYLIDIVSGEKYPQFVKDNIFTPLGMTDSGYDVSATVLSHRAAGYTPTPGGEIVNTGYIDMTIPYSAGALYSTTHDLWKWERALYGGKLLKGQSLTKMTTPYKDSYACGLVISTATGHKQISHGGGIEGFNTELAYYPDGQLAIVVLGNLNGGAPGEIAGKAATVEFGGSITLTSERKEITLTPAQLTALVGTYSLAPGVDLAVTLEGNQVWTQLTGQGKLQIFAESPMLFFLKVVDAQLEFAKDASGKVAQVTLHQNGRDMVAKRK
jgi:CubicO group peptidase (beta-lactamase class C family)